MKRGMLLSALILAAGLSFGQEEAETAAEEGPWKKGGVVGLNFSQTYLSNWQGGGQSAINGVALVNLYANWAKDKWTWDNSLDAAYGLTRIGDNGSIQKTDDKIDFNSKIGRETPMINTYWAGMFQFKSQWDAGYDYADAKTPLISDPLAPAYILAGIGIDYKPSEGFTAYISPITNKTTIVDNQRLADAGAFGVTPATYDAAGVKTSDGENVRYEVGGYVKLQYAKDILENVKLTTKLDLFSNYLDRPQNVDVNWETLVAMKINDFLSASITTHLIYDHDIKFAVDRDGDGVAEGTKPGTQFKEVFSLGIQYQF